MRSTFKLTANDTNYELMDLDEEDGEEEEELHEEEDDEDDENEPLQNMAMRKNKLKATLELFKSNKIMVKCIKVQNFKYIFD